MKLINIKEASKETSLKESYLRYLVLTKQIPHYKFGRLVRVNMIDLENWIRLHKREVEL